MAGRYPDLDEIAAIYSELRRRRSRGPLSLKAIEVALGIPRRRARVILSMFKREGKVVELRGMPFKLSGPDLEDFDLEAIAREHERRAQTDRRKLEQMMLFGQIGSCRWKFLLDYFDNETDWQHCGNCDNCLVPPETRIGPRG